MQSLIVTLFVLVCIAGIFKPMWALGMIVYINSMEQLLQTAIPYWSTFGFGGQVVNYIVGVVSLTSVSLLCFRNSNPWRGFLNTTFVMITFMIVWSMISLAWSLDAPGGIAMMKSRWPYFFLSVVIGSMLVTDFQDLRKLVNVLIIMGLAISVLILINPQFTSQYGRLGLIQGGLMTSNPLALGELGGILFISGAVFRSNNLGKFAWILRLAALIFGATMAVQSGSRGQVVLCALVAAIFYPVAAPVQNLRSFFGTLIGIACIVIIMPIFLSTTLEGFAAKRFTSDALLYGSSSFSERITNITILISAWLGNPTSTLIGLGYFSFNAIGGGTTYSHVIIADLIFELGLPGIIVLCVLCVSLSRSSRLLFSLSKNNALDRSATATFLAITFFLFLLANKQGDLWGSTILYMCLAIVVRLSIRSEEDAYENSIATTEEGFETQHEQ